MFEGKLTPRGKNTVLDISGPSVLQFLNFANLSISAVYIFANNFLLSAPKSGCFTIPLREEFISIEMLCIKTVTVSAEQFCLECGYWIDIPVEVNTTNSRLIIKLAHKPQKRSTQKPCRALR